MLSAECYLFENDVDVTSNELSYLLSLSCLHRIVTILVVSKVLKARQREGEKEKL